MKAMLPRPPADPQKAPRPPELAPRYRQLRREMVDRLEQTAAVENHWLLYTLLGWENLAACVLSHFLAGGEPGWPCYRALALVWLVQIGLALGTARLVSGPPRFEDSPLQPYIRNLWLIFLLLCCNVALLTVVTRQPATHYLPLLGTLSSFLFLVSSFLFSRRFIAAALTMFATGTLTARLPQYGFLLYGAGWLLVLQTMGVLFLRKRPRWLADLPGTQA